MKYGIHLPHIGRNAGPEWIREAAIHAEHLGFDDVWVSEHVILPKDANYPPTPFFYDPIVTLTWAAAFTSRVGLGTSVLVLPMRHPLPLAKELATLQNLSQGRLILGAGIGWLEAEFAALGSPFRERGRRMDEGIAMMRAVWKEDPVTFRPRWIPAIIEQMRMQPLPCAPIPIWIGGSVSPEQAGPIVRRLREERPEGSFTISVRTRWNAEDPQETKNCFVQFSEAGVQHLLLEIFERHKDAWMRAAEQIARHR